MACCVPLSLTNVLWLKPEIHLVTRDRGGDYASAASQGAPQAAQSADRFHLVKNLTEAVQKALVHCRAELQKETKRVEPVDPKAGRRVCTLSGDL